MIRASKIILLCVELICATAIFGVSAYLWRAKSEVNTFVIKNDLSESTPESINPQQSESSPDDGSTDDIYKNSVINCDTDDGQERFRDWSSKIVGKPIVRDIDGDGIVEKIVRYDIEMADRYIQVLYIYRSIGKNEKLLASFCGDPYGFAWLENDGSIQVGRYIPIEDVSVGKNWDDFDEFEIRRYHWSARGISEIGRKTFKSSKYDDLPSDALRKYY
ncbi:MAG: hypothetical protein WCJ25_04185 [Candidatus Moraniibacteriota bacterium]